MQTSIQNTTSRRGERPSVKSVEVASFTTSGRSYRVYPDYGYCSCPHHTNTGATCKHLRLVRAPEYTITHVYRYGRDMYEIHDSEGGYEGCVPSFVDAFEVVTIELGGVLGAPGVGGYYGLEGA